MFIFVRKNKNIFNEFFFINLLFQFLWTCVTLLKLNQTETLDRYLTSVHMKLPIKDDQEHPEPEIEDVPNIGFVAEGNGVAPNEPVIFPPNDAPPMELPKGVAVTGLEVKGLLTPTLLASPNFD